MRYYDEKSAIEFAKDKANNLDFAKYITKSDCIDGLIGKTNDRLYNLKQDLTDTFCEILMDNDYVFGSYYFDKPEEDKKASIDEFLFLFLTTSMIPAFLEKRLEVLDDE